MVVGAICTYGAFPANNNVVVLMPAYGILFVEPDMAEHYAVHVHSPRVTCFPALLVHEHPRQMSNEDVWYTGQLPTPLHRHDCHEVVNLSDGILVIGPGFVVQFECGVVKIPYVGGSCRHCDVMNTPCQSPSPLLAWHQVFILCRCGVISNWFTLLNGKPSSAHNVFIIG